MLDLGTLKIGVEVDDSQASAGLSSLSQTIDKTEEASNGASKGNDKLSTSLNKLGTQAEGTTQKVNTFQIMVGNLAAKAVAKLANTIKNSLGSAISRVDTMNNFSKTMESLGYTAEEADASIEKISDTIQPLPVALDEATASSQKFTALFGDINKGTEVWSDVTNAAFAAGQGTEAASRAQDAWYKILAKGKPEAEQWQALNETMPAQMKQLAQEMLGANATSQDLFAAWQSGKITTEEVTDAMHKLTTEGGDGFESWAEQAKIANAGIQTSIENVKLAVTRNVAKIIDIFSEDFVSGAEGASTAIDKIGDALVPVAKVLKTLSPLLKPLLAALGTFITVIGTYSAAMKIATAAQAAWNAVMAINPTVLIVAGIMAVIAAIALLIKNWDKVKAVLKKGLDFVINTKPIQTAISWVKKLIEWWNKLKEAAKKVIEFTIKRTTVNQSKSADSKTGGKTGQRIGLKEVPYDGYETVLHKGETVLTAAETNLLTNQLNSAKLQGEQGKQVNTITNTENVTYAIGDITLDVSSIKDIPTIEDFVTMLTRAKAFA